MKVPPAEVDKLVKVANEKQDKRAAYWKEVGPYLREFEKLRAPSWARFMNGEITHADYRELIGGVTKAVMNEIEPIWVKHGGKPTK